MIYDLPYQEPYQEKKVEITVKYLFISKVVILSLLILVINRDASATDEVARSLKEVNGKYAEIYHILANSTLRNEQRLMIMKNIKLAQKYIAYFSRVNNRTETTTTPEGGYWILTEKAHKDYPKWLLGNGAGCDCDPSKNGEIIFNSPFLWEVKVGDKVFRSGIDGYEDYFVTEGGTLIIPGINLIFELADIAALD